MNQKFDDITLSSYVDGELDPESMQEVEAFLESDSDARKYVVNAIRTTARLRESMNQVLYEEVPENLINAILPEKKREGWRSTILKPMLRMAAAVALVVIGFGAGWLVPTSEETLFWTIFSLVASLNFPHCFPTYISYTDQVTLHPCQ